MFQPIIWHALYLMSGPHVYLLRYFCLTVSLSTISGSETRRVGSPGE
ncbi:hypothetical protein SLEP1_g58098 [Rubroshorea leprosula]|uniref:Uncharacterized protein n=1 Tax=Rubroshorea leprosula TaxID=152421 RepID=A0AAV5MNM4_9ROSI|nr:hypothetical protein SLEP1_g58098 [Rubroshorea leprosula]